MQIQILPRSPLFMNCKFTKSIINMGGNALKHIGVDRKSSDDYWNIVNKVITKFQPFCERIAVIPSYRNKQDFGDADILIIPNKDVPHLGMAIESVFVPRCIQHNGSCYSFDVDNFQVDLITTDAITFDTTLNYYSYNDLGCLIGRIAHKLGLKYGHDGLTVPVRKLDSHLGEVVLVTKDTSKALSFLGYDRDRFFEGFDTLEDIFDYAISTKYFNADIFSFDNMNHANRTRNRKRKVYNQFLDYLNNKSGLSNYEFNKDKSSYIPMIKEYFPEANLDEEFARVDKKVERSKILSEKFNGDIVTSLTGLTGKDLGDFIMKFKANFKDKKDFENSMVDISEEMIHEIILGQFKG